MSTDLISPINSDLDNSSKSTKEVHLRTKSTTTKTVTSQSINMS